MNLYAYVRSNPVNLWDPLGLVDLNLSPRDELDAVEGMDRWNPQVKWKGVGFTVGGHGNPCGDDLTDSVGAPLTVERLAALILANPGYKKGETVTLYMCNTGAPCARGDNFAQRLADILQAPVRAPDGFMVAIFYKTNKKSSEIWLSDEYRGSPTPGLKFQWHEPRRLQNSKKFTE